MTRFWITMEQAVDLVIFALGAAMGAEIYVPDIPAMPITDVAHAIQPNCGFEEIGIRPGEKVHEKLVSEDTNRVFLVTEDRSTYSSDTAPRMTVEELREMLCSSTD
jgi:UDP-N-acetylglucosamine 4,6-dehydratase